MKVTVSERKSPENFIPKMMQSIYDSRLIVLATCRHSNGTFNGTVMRGGDYSSTVLFCTAETSSNFEFEKFKDFHGTVTLENE